MDDGVAAVLTERIEALEEMVGGLERRMTNVGQHVGGLQARAEPPPTWLSEIVPCQACQDEEGKPTGLVGTKVCWGCRGAGVHRV